MQAFQFHKLFRLRFFARLCAPLRAFARLCAPLRAFVRAFARLCSPLRAWRQKLEMKASGCRMHVFHCQVTFHIRSIKKWWSKDLMQLMVEAGIVCFYLLLICCGSSMFIGKKLLKCLKHNYRVWCWHVLAVAATYCNQWHSWSSGINIL